MRIYTVCLVTGFFLGSVIVLASNVVAQQGSTKQPAESSTEKIQLAIDDLGSPNFGTRTAAAIQLRAMGFEAKEAIGRAAADHPDADARARAAKIHVDLQHGISPETPASIVNAIRAIRFGTATKQSGGVRFLIDNERFDLLLAAVRLRREMNPRTQLAMLILQNADGQKYFLQQENMVALFDSLAGDGPPLSWSDQVKFFTPEIITGIVVGNQLDSLIDFFKRAPDPERLEALARIMENAAAVELLAWSENANELFKVIDLGSTPQAKQELVSKVFANPVLMSKLLRTGAMTRLLDLYDENDARLASLFNTPKAMQLIADSANAKQIIELLNRFNSNETRNSAARSIYSATAKKVIAEPASYSELRKYFLDLGDPWFQFRMTVDELRVALTKTPKNKDEIQAAFNAVVSTNAKLEPAEVIELLRQSAIIDLVTTPEGLPWLCHELSQLTIEDRFSALQRIYRQTSFINALAVEDGSRFFVFLDTILNVEDARFQAITISLVSQIRIDVKNPREWLYAGLLERLKPTNVPLVRHRIMMCIANHQSMLYQIASDGKLDALVEQMESLGQTEEQTQAWRMLLRNPVVTKKLVELGRLDVLLTYVDPNSTTQTRYAMLSQIIRSPDAVANLLERNKFDVLDKAVQELAAADPNSDAIGLFYSNELIIIHCLERGRGKEILDYIKNISASRLSAKLSPFASRNLPVSLFDEIGETIWMRCEEIPKGLNSDRGAFHSKLLSNEQFIGWMIQENRASDVLDRMSSDFDLEERRQVMRTFLDNPSSAPWLESITLDKYFDFVERGFTGNDLGYLNLMLGGSKLHEHIVSTNQGRKLFDFTMRLEAKAETGKYTVLETLAPGTVLRTLVATGFGLELFEHYQNADPGNRTQAMLRLAKEPGFSQIFLQKHSAKHLLDAVWEHSNREHAHQLAIYLLTYPAWHRDLEQRGDLRVVGNMLLKESSTKSRDEAIARLIGSATNPNALTDNETETYYQAIYKSDEKSKAGMTWLLRSQVAVKRLIQLGHFDELKQLAGQAFGQDQVTSFFRHPQVLERLNEEERTATIEQYWTELQDEKRRIPFPRDNELFATIVRQRGIAPIMEVAKSKAPDTVFTLWLDDAVLTAVIARGELVEFWNGTPEQYRGRAVTHVWQRLRLRQNINALASKHSVSKFADWLDTLSNREILGFPISQEGIATSFYRAGLGARYAKFTDRFIESRKERSDSRFPMIELERYRASNDRISFQIERGEIAKVADQLRQSIRIPRGALNYVSFLVANELADEQWEFLEDKLATQLDAHEPLVMVLLARALGKNEKAIELAQTFKLDYWPGLLAVEQHDWKTAASSPLPRSSFLMSPSIVTGFELTKSLREPADPELDELERLVMSGIVANFAGDAKTNAEAVSSIKRIIAAKRGNLKLEQYAVEGLILLGRGGEACDNFGFHPWQRFALYRARGFYDPAFAACGWDGRPSTTYFDAATRSTDIGHELRLRGVSFMLELATTERTLGRYDRAREIDDALSVYAQKQTSKIASLPVASGSPKAVRDPLASKIRSYQSKLFAEWMHRGNHDACERWWDAQKDFDEHAIRYACFGPTGTRNGDGLVFDELLRRTEIRMPLVERMRRVGEILNSPIDHEFTQSFAIQASRLLNDQASSRNTESTRLFDVVTRHWGSRGEVFPLEDSASKIWIDRTTDMESMRWYAVARMRKGQFIEAARVLGEACQYNSARPDLLYLQGEALIRSATDESQRKLGEDLRQLAIRQLYNASDVIRLAESLQVAGYTDAAISMWHLVRNVSFPASMDYVAATNRLSQLCSDVTEASHLKRESLVWLGTQQANRGEPVELLAQVEAMHYAAMTVDLEKANFSALVHHWEQLRVANSNQSAEMKLLIPRIDKAGHKEIADEMFQVTLQFVTSRVEKFSQSIEFRLARAELCIACGRELEMARQDLDDAEKIAGKELVSISDLRKRLDT